jgi:hypothetical protein
MSNRKKKKQIDMNHIQKGPTTATSLQDRARANNGTESRGDTKAEGVG